MTRVRLGACLSLSGRYGRFGRQAADGLKVWQSLAGEGVELRVEDDGSDPDRVAGALARLAGGCDLLLGPYSTQLMREAGRAMADVDGLLWNHGGSGDDAQEQCPGRIVSVLAPTGRYAEPFVRALEGEADRAPLWVVRGRGRFGRQVAAGAVRHAKRSGLEAVEKRAHENGASSFGETPDVWDLFSVGTFEDDVEIVNDAGSAPRPPRAVCSVAAGVRDFASMVEKPNGMYGIAQWFPGRAERPELGPSEDDFVTAYRRLVRAWPDYPAVQAAAAAALAVHCARLAGGVEPDALWTIASGLETTTLYGAFRIDARSGVQLGHAPVLVRWHDGQPQPVA
jgi:ABC-type branched-subunit amino acid transport system substrate-binding protein